LAGPKLKNRRQTVVK